MTALRLGKKPAVFDSRTLRFGKYLQPQLQPPPPVVDYGQKVKAWPMYGNDQYGDCTCAAAGHMIQDWTANAAGEVTPPLNSVLNFYYHFVGPNPGPDAGCNMLDVLKYWRSEGLDDHKIVAFTQLEPDNTVEAKDAVNLFGSCYIGVALPDFAVTGTDWLSIPWVVPPQGPVGNAAPNQKNGHCICAVAYDARNLYVVTWGAVKAMSWQFYTTYADEAFAVLSSDFLKDGKAPAGFNLQQLKQDLAAVDKIPPSAAHIMPVTI